MQPQIIDKLVSFDNVPGGDLVIKHEQYIPDEFIRANQMERADSIRTPAGEFHRVASIPTAKVDEWKAQGFDINVEPIREILKRLRNEQLDGFITSNKV